MTQSKIILCVTHVAGNALLLLLGYYWLGLGESDAAHLAFSAAVILFGALAAIWLHGTSLILFKHDTTFLAAGKRAIRHLLPLFLLGILVLLIYLALQHFYVSFGHQAFTIGSYSTMKLRRPVEPQKVVAAFHGFIWLLRWFVVPVFAMPLAAELATLGWSGLRLGAFRRSRKPLFWMESGVLLLAAIYLPLRLFFWIPTMHSFAMQVVSVTARIGLGYLLFTGGLLAVEFFTASGSPAVTQPNTADSP